MLCRRTYVLGKETDFFLKNTWKMVEDKKVLLEVLADFLKNKISYKSIL